MAGGAGGRTSCDGQVDGTVMATTSKQGIQQRQGEETRDERE